MDIGYRRYVTEYIDFIENISNVIDVSLYNNMEISIDELINSVLQYVHENFPAKYDLNGTFSLPKIQEYMEKGNKDLTICFKSVSFGTNVSYKDTVTNIASDIFGTIQRSSNNNLIFAKKTQETQNFIQEEVLKSYRNFMNSYGKELMEKGVNPLEVLLETIKNYEETSNKDIIDEYTHTMTA